MKIICIREHKVDDEGDALPGLMGKVEQIKSDQLVVEWDSGSWGFYTIAEFEKACKVVGEPTQEQALKHFDELLRVAQEVLQEAEEPDGNPPVYCIGAEAVERLDAIVQKISDEAAEIIGEAKKC